MVRSFTQSEQAADPVALAEPACIAAGQRLAGPQIESIKACRAHRLQRPTSHHCSQVALHPPRSSCAKTVAKQQTWLTTAPPMSRVLDSQRQRESRAIEPQHGPGRDWDASDVQNALGLGSKVLSATGKSLEGSMALPRPHHGRDAPRICLRQDGGTVVALAA
jgi:hypothetical protein